MFALFLAVVFIVLNGFFVAAEFAFVKVSTTLASTPKGPREDKRMRRAREVVGRIDRKVDADKVQELAAEHGLTDHLSTLFRWKPEINMAIWKAADESITKPLAAAITAKPGRPSFTIEPITTKE